MKRDTHETGAMRKRRLAAGNPGVSAWVSANAGSGKTFVLTQRVLRLLLSNVAPEKLLCLTYTKAAAAEMRKRVGEQLSSWSLMDNRALDQELTRLGVEKPDLDVRKRARTLFARALDTPGGLKINTIHAFCEAVLHRFPMEAGVPFDFTVVEDDERKAMIDAAREAVLAEGLVGAGALAEASAVFLELASDTTIENALDEALKAGARLRRLLAEPAVALDNLRAEVGLPEGDTLKAIDREIVEGAIIPPEEYPALAAHLSRLEKTTRLAKKVAEAASLPDGVEKMFAALLNGQLGVSLDYYFSKALRADAELAKRIEAEMFRLGALAERRARARVYATSEALLILLGEILTRYDRAKRARSLVDFDDLIQRLGALLADQAAAWVAYKLDMQIEHILVDESQDTNPEQWAVIEALAKEFFSGAGATEKVRTLFAVGDEKQSIYSFQGAEPRLFAEMGDWARQKTKEVERKFENVELKASFRSLTEILQAVDDVFAHEAAYRGLERHAQKTGHEAARREKGGFVELWTPLKKEKPEPREGDAYPTEPEPEDAVERELAQDIAAKIKGWIDGGRKLAGSDRAVMPGDVLILLQTRSPLFHDIISALKEIGLPNAGADRLTITDHIAVRDLMVLGDVMLNISDQLGLATLLRSPLIGLSEAQLEALCVGRAGPLWEELAGRGESWAKAAHEKLAFWRGRLDLDRPYDFFANILFAGGGLKRMHERLGPEIDDVIAEFLDLALAHEQEAQPSMQGFLAGLRAEGHTVKRELATREGQVRVMSVHGAKGLEAPIVILADAAAKPSSKALGGPIFLKADRDEKRQRYLVFPAGAKPETDRIARLKEARKEAEFEEYHRRLYVAMTRAENELYVTGIVPQKESGGDEPSWYSLIEDGLMDKLSEADADGVRRYPANAKPTMVKIDKAAAAEIGKAEWTSPLPAPRQVSVLTPSLAGEETPVLSGGGNAELARLKGIAIHALLQFLPRLPEGERAARGLRALAAYLPEDATLRGQVLDRALAILDDPALAEIFGPQSRAEVPVLAEIDGPGGVQRVIGRIDRLIAGPPLRIVDFKSDATPPAQGGQVPPAYLGQLALYRRALRKIFPDQAVEAAILWTETGHLAKIDPETLDAAARAFTAS